MWKGLYDFSPGFAFSLAHDGTLLRINSNFKNRLGYDAANEILHIDEILTIGSKIFYQTHLASALQLKANANEVFLSFKSQDSAPVPVLLNVIKMGDNEQAQLHFSGIEITQRHHYEKELQASKAAAEKALYENNDRKNILDQLKTSQEIIESQSQVIAQLTGQHVQLDKVLSHELQEPLRKMSMFASRIVTDEPEIALNILKIKEASERMRNLLDKLQKLHSVDSGPFNPAEIGFKKLLDKAFQKVAAKQGNFSFSYEEAKPIAGDSILLMHLFEELFENSVKFRNESIELKIDIIADQYKRNIFINTEDRYQYETCNRIIYRDNGTGFSQHYAEQVFELFKKLQGNYGLGIGLSYVKKIVERHSGTISVKSENGVGTEFTIVLPVAYTNLI